MKKLLVLPIIAFFALLAVTSWAQSSSDGGGIPSHHYLMDFNSEGEPFFNENVSENDPLVVKDYWDSLFYRSTGYDSLIDRGLITTMATDGDNLYIGGSFEYFDGIRCFNVIRYNRSTGIWSKLDSGFNSTVNILKVHNGKLYAGGRFNGIGFNGSTPMNNIAVWNSATGKWEQVGGGVNNSVTSIEFMDTSIIIGGFFSKELSSGMPLSYIARWNGQAWDDMNGGTTDVVWALLATGDSLYVGGDFYSRTTLISGVALYVGGNWQTLGNGLDGPVYALALYKGQLWVGGDFFATATDDQELFCISRWDGTNWIPVANGQDTGTKDAVFSITVDGDSIYIGGSFQNIAGIAAHGIVKWKNGQFSPIQNGVYGEVHSILSYMGSLYAGGTFLMAGNLSVNNFAKIEAGDIWKTPETPIGAIGGYSETSINTVATTADYVFIGGNFSTIRKSPFNHIAAWDKVHREWIPLGKGVDAVVDYITVYGSNVYVGGAFNYAGDSVARHIAYWDMNTKLWHPMGNSSLRYVSAIAANETGVYAPVFFPFTANIGFYDFLGQWDGTAWNMINNRINGYINTIAAQSSSLYIGGAFTYVESMKVSHIAHYDGTNWFSLGSGLSDRVVSLAIAGNDIYAAGYFGNAGTLTVKGIARWNGTVWNDLAGGLNAPAITLGWNGSALYVGGEFTQTVNGVSAKYLAKWDGNNWTTVSNGTGSSVYGLAVDNAGLYVGGAFNHVNGLNLFSYRFGILHFTLAGVSKSSDDNPSVQNFPNPFNAETTVSYSLDNDGIVDMGVYDLLGVKVRTLVNEFKMKGDYEVPFDATGLPNGTYICRFTSGGRTQKSLLSLVK